MSSWWQFPWHPPHPPPSPNWRFYRERTINFFKDRHYLREVPWMDPTRSTRGPLVAIHPYTPSRMGKTYNIYIYNAWVCDVFFQHGDLNEEGTKNEQMTFRPFQVAISTAMFWRWGHGMMEMNPLELWNCCRIDSCCRWNYGEMMEYPLSKYFMVFFQSYSYVIVLLQGGAPQL